MCVGDIYIYITKEYIYVFFFNQGLKITLKLISAVVRVEGNLKIYYLGQIVNTGKNTNKQNIENIASYFRSHKLNILPFRSMSYSKRLTRFGQKRSQVMRALCS